MASNGTTISARYDYDPYGRRTKLSGGYDADFGYTGHFHEQPGWMTTGVNLTLFRVYDPELGRWLSRDPIGEPTTRMIMSKMAPARGHFPIMLSFIPKVIRPHLGRTPGEIINPYRYVDNEVLTQVDPLGLWGLEDLLNWLSTVFGTTSSGNTFTGAAGAGPDAATTMTLKEAEKAYADCLDNPPPDDPNCTKAEQRLLELQKKCASNN